MRMLIFDTETTGLPKSRQPSSKGPNNWPHIVSISWVILNSDTNKVEKERSYIITPSNWVIPEESIRIHGITQEKAQTQGSDLAKVMGEFLAENYDVLVAHNLEFDYNVIHNAVQWDLEIPFGSLYKKMVCTMELSRDICKLKTMYGRYKSPKLSELYEHVFKKSPKKESLHTSIYDVLILTEIIQSCDELRLKMNLPTNTLPVTTQNVNQANAKGVLSFRLE
jgi:DNA polymerase III epsilon subunit-like protein